MKKFNSISVFILLTFVATVFVSCEEESTSPSNIAPFGSTFTTAETAGTITLGFQLDNPTKEDVTVNLSISGGTATEGDDFELLEETRVIPAGESNGSFSIELLNDIADEADETIEVSISAEGLETTGKYVITVTDDDCPFEFVGDLVGTDANLDKAHFVGEGAVTVVKDGDTYTIEGLNVDFMENFWGETVINQVPVTMTIDGAGNITIPDQYIFTTLYDGAEYEYHIYGTGVLNTCDGNITLNYEMDQDGFKVATYVHSPGNWMTDLLFKAVLAPAE